MKLRVSLYAFAVTFATINGAQAQPSGAAIAVTADNFKRKILLRQLAILNYVNPF
jgi:hypothetical protein